MRIHYVIYVVKMNTVFPFLKLIVVLSFTIVGSLRETIQVKNSLFILRSIAHIVVALPLRMNKLESHSVLRPRTVFRLSTYTETLGQV